MTLRSDLLHVAHWIPQQARVLDLGCGNGDLLAYLRDHKQCDVLGVEREDAAVLACMRKGLNVVQQDLEAGLSLFDDNAFDVVIQTETLQQMRRVEPILAEIARVGREAILSFPNFGYWQHRWQLIKGRMPVSKTLPFQWFDTPNIRCATLADFADFAAKHGLLVQDRVALHEGERVNLLPNLRGSLAVFRLSKA
ncbi:MAG: methionine biosynthesis protein MetW [Burkholderiaceae bacterium]